MASKLGVVQSPKSFMIPNSLINKKCRAAYFEFSTCQGVIHTWLVTWELDLVDDGFSRITFFGKFCIPNLHHLFLEMYSIRVDVNSIPLNIVQK
jgi:hypothetical protein